MKRILFIISIFLYVCESAAIAQEQLQNEIQQIADKYKAIGVAYAVVKDNKIVYDGAVGYQNVAAGIPLDAEKSLFRIASISKSFTATAIMQLVEQGKISLDDDFGDLIGFPIRNPLYPDKVITLRMVLSHTSSINDSNGYFDLAVINPSTNNNWKNSYSKNEPGSTYDYCNLNFNMTGAVLERLTGQRFDGYIKDQILSPIGIYGGYCVDSLDNNRFAQLYAYENNTFEIQPSAYNPRSEEIKNYQLGRSTPVFSPTGGMKISAVDLAKYMQMHMNYGKSDKHRIISKESALTMQTKISDKEGYGLGLRQVTDFIPGIVMVGHTGSAYGLYSTMFFSPADKYGIVVITNGCIPTYTDGKVDLLREIANLLYSRIIQQ
ncbi:serine hydrolase domain-containing protein [Sphingobacterium rhinopitheci]|uniref:serine hydrolase domain-containing protein n=1 Tax=Sphingobacterium rhinopitheci TaxID=2781960 RepID=UPI001F52424E|nr:serine hydrolase domain-containing protein [Sphingobacterium rhinopitheci]MCI0919753.1 beta-lactamase family protein [Sphingobacterium rhinopitheci]